MKKIIYFVLFVVLCEGAGVIGSLFTFSQIPGWYASLNKPTFSPPNWLFGPVWISLYILMGIAMFLVWNKKENQGRKFALWFFVIHLAVNSLWSIVFFGLEQTGWGLLVIIILWLMILASIYLFAKISKIAAWLLVPYLLWVTFASYLNYSVWILNRHL